MKDKKNTRVIQKQPRSKPHKIRTLFLSMLCLGVIFLGMAVYLKVSSAIKPFDELTTLDPEPLNSGFADDHESSGGDKIVPNEGNGSNTPQSRKEGVYTILLAGTDLDDYHTDVLMVACLDTKNSTLNVINIPRDTQVAVKRGSKKINAAWGVGKIDQLNRELKTVIGFVPDAYAVVDLKGFVKLVDAIGGVDFDVPQSMNYEDPSQNLYIHLNKGPQHLNGKEAIQLVRFRRYREGDLKRVEVQQTFLKEVFKQTISLKNIFKINEFASIAKEHLRSNLDVGQMVWFGQEIMKLEDGAVNFYTLPGNPDGWYKGANYVLVDRDAALELINDKISPFTAEITKEHVNISSLNDRKRSK